MSSIAHGTAYLGNREMGRPTKYNKAIQQKADDYVDGAHLGASDPVPSVAGLACYLGVNKQTLYNWGDNHPQFLDTLDRCKERQEKLALMGGLTNEFNASIVKLLLANHGYSDRQQLEHSGKDGAPLGISVRFID